MKGQAKYIIGLIIIIAGLGFGLLSLRRNMTPYLPFSEAMGSRGVVQVFGKIDQASAKYDPTEGVLRFNLSDGQGRTMPVVYRGVKPGNFEQAPSAVAIGTYREAAFQADQILVKCPSKYQALEKK
jgi:cytochrome c-type biogenesis protein CcmE